MRTAVASDRLWFFFAVLPVTAFVLNWLWEMIQMPAYVEMAGRNWRETALRCAAASLGDVALVALACGLGALAAGDWRWVRERRWNVYAAAALNGAVLASAVEWQALGAGHWSYSSRMPVVPLLGVGLWPFLQLSLLTPLCLAVAQWWAGGARPASGRGRRLVGSGEHFGGARPC